MIGIDFEKMMKKSLSLNANINESADEMLKECFSNSTDLESFVKQNKDKFSDEHLSLINKHLESIRESKKTLNELKNSK